MRNPSPVATWRFVPSVVWPMGATHSRSSRSAQPESGGHLALRTVRSLATWRYALLLVAPWSFLTLQNGKVSKICLMGES